MKCAIYARVSSEKQEQEGTIKSQITALRDFGSKNNFEIVDEYLDDGYSGELLARPQLDRLRDDADRGRFEKVLILHPDRLSRKYAYQVLIMEEFKKRNIGVEFVNHKIGDNPEDELLLQVQGAVAEYEKTKILERSRRGKLAQAKSGRIIGNIAPYGYAYEKGQAKNTRGYTINEEEAKVVKTIFSLYLELGSLSRVSKELKELGIAPRKKGNIWRHSSLYRVLRDETYIGTTYYGKHRSVEKEGNGGYKRTKKSGREWREKKDWLPIEVAPIVDKTIFENTQRLLQKRFKPFGTTRLKYMLGGLLRCATCGNTFAGENSHDYRYYRCSNRQRRHPLPKNCDAKMIFADKLEGVVWKAMFEIITKPSLLIKSAGLGAKEEELKRDEEQGFFKELKALEVKLDKEIARRERLVEIYRDGDISKEDYRVKIEASYSAIESLKKEKAEKDKILQQSKNIPLLKEVIYNFSKLMKLKMSNLTYDQKQLVLRLLIDRIIVDSNNKSIVIKGVIPTREPEKVVNGLFSQVNSLSQLNPSGSLPYLPKKAKAR